MSPSIETICRLTPVDVGWTGALSDEIAHTVLQWIHDVKPESYDIRVSALGTKVMAIIQKALDEQHLELRKKAQ